MSKPRLKWNQLKGSGARGVSATIIGTALGAGFFPYGPGTMGALVAVPLAYWSSDWSWPLRLALWVGLTLVGTWAAKVIDEVTGASDNQSIVIDEVVGLGITAWTAGQNSWALIAAFLLFRFFDILKPPPVRQLDTWSKKKASETTASAKWWGGFGVIADDIVAGFQGLAVMAILQHLQWLP